MGARYIDGGIKNWQKENSATKDPIGKHVQESSRRTIVTNCQKSARIEYTQTHTHTHTHNTRKSDISWNNTPSMFKRSWDQISQITLSAGKSYRLIYRHGELMISQTVPIHRSILPEDHSLSIKPLLLLPNGLLHTFLW